MSRIILPDAQTLRDLFDYDPETGVLRRRKSRYGRKTGSITGTIWSSGYRVMKINGGMFTEHSIIWALWHGASPPSNLEIDHINRDRADNRINNLRLATRSQNCANRSVSPLNKLRIKGVDLHAASGKYRAQIKHGGRKIHLGLFETAEAAHQAYTLAALRYHGEFARAA